MSLTLSKLIGQWLLPPADLLLLAFLGLLGWRKWWGRGLVLLCLLALWLLGTTPVHNALLAPLEQADPPLALNDAAWRQADAIVVLGGGTYERAPEFGGKDMPGAEAMQRLLYAAELARHSELPVYVTGGVPPDRVTQQPEGRSMAEWLVRLGIERDRIHSENEALNTWQNATRIRAMLPKAQRIVLVTSAYHMPRARWAFQQQGFAVIAAPCSYKRDLAPLDLLSWLVPKAHLFHESYIALHEYLGLVWYRWHESAQRE